MDIDEALELLERDHVENDIKKLSAKDRLNFWQTLKEFRQPKLQRSGFVQDVELPEKIIIEIVK